MINPILYVIIIVLLAGFGLLFYFLMDLKKKSEKPSEDPNLKAASDNLKLALEWMKEMKQDTQQDRELTQKNIHETNKQINDRLTEAARYIGQLKQEIGAVSQIGPDIRRLTETLASPKLRGNFGEEMLEKLLDEVLPKNSFQSQYKFKNGETVDVIVKFGTSMLPIDSKFSMENFRFMKEAKTEELVESYKKSFLKDVKKRVDEIHKKYILPQEGTFDFALMYVPSEGIYQEIIPDEDIMLYCRSKRVMPVGPNSLFVYLQNVIVSLRGQEINKVAQQILTMINGIKQESDKLGRNLEVLGNHVKNANNAMGTITNDFSKLKTNIGNAASLRLDEPKSEQKALID